ncbi:hypothetical protein K3495_g11520 [Podosphaera aphanis]|nr:hypothetical protein K3495_g11520 [Podosphaera aphanis]
MKNLHASNIKLTQHLLTILHAWEKVGLIKKSRLSINPQAVLNTLESEFSETIAATVNLGANTTPSTPTSRHELPFQDPLTTATRAAHSKHLDQRLDDHINYDIPLTPSFKPSLHAFTQGVESKAIASELYKKREQVAAEAAKEASRCKAGSSRRLQVGGVTYKGQGTRDIEWLNSHPEESRKTKNIAQARKEVLKKEIKVAIGRCSSRNTAKGRKDIAMQRLKSNAIIDAYAYAELQKTTDPGSIQRIQTCQAKDISKLLPDELRTPSKPVKEHSILELLRWERWVTKFVD